MRNYKELLQHINTFIFDYDGVLTDGSVITTNEGELILFLALGLGLPS